MMRGLGTYSTAHGRRRRARSPSAACCCSRPLWLLLTQSLPRVAARPPGSRRPVSDSAAASSSSLSWAGTRGVISLAAIFALPLATGDRHTVPGARPVAVLHLRGVLVTLVGQGLTFAPLVRALGVRADPPTRPACATRRGWRRSRPPSPASASSARSITTTSRTMRSTRSRRSCGTGVAVTSDARAARIRRGRRDPDVPAVRGGGAVRRAVLEAQRDELLRWRDIGRLPDSGLRALQRELDHEEGLLPTRDPH